MTAFAAGMGLFYQTPGEPFTFSNHRGETNLINGNGLYYFDTVSSAAQMQGNDLVTLVVGLPLLLISTWLAIAWLITRAVSADRHIGLHPVYLYVDVYIDLL